MDVIRSVFQWLIDLGAPVFLAIILTLIGIVFRMKITRAISAGLTLGVALAGITLVVDYMLQNVGEASKAFVENTGVSLTALDMGWPPALGMAWGWQFAFLMFPIQIVVNLVMLALRWTSCLNVDMWNVGNKVLTAFLVTYVSDMVWLGFTVAALQAVAELKNADVTRYRLQKLTGIPGVSMPHPMFLTGIWLYPFIKVMDRLLPSTWNIDAQKLRDKIGVFGENHVMGFLIGCGIGALGGYGPSAVLTLGIQAAAALTLFPMVAKLFTTALTPVSEAATNFTKRRFNDREFTIGLDWPIMAGRSEHWLLMILTIPVLLLYALILPGNMVLPFGGLMNICLVVPLFFFTMGNFVKMAIGTIIGIPMQLYVATFFAPYFTSLAERTGGVEPPAGQQLAWFGMDISELRYIVVDAASGSLIGIALAVVTAVLAFFYFRGIKRDDLVFEAELEGTNVAPNT
ncbi:PTS galactitol transporter subunit IIC [Aeromicrobium sp. YIM 150415]|uniref:PTS galactitol transporter subunit IIC n=1 Tax=Aeromicrobium sp. YIM 150415 TaxID=2803912 RepID=UPI001965D44A|nr:PTS transporter subunit IIC [Aeromicrobium sp. YIM 150415]MBM9464666.1 PTS galactitol transporter subunit IIC [Aeromicrobium sp. YIM 150415]